MLQRAVSTDPDKPQRAQDLIKAGVRPGVESTPLSTNKGRLNAQERFAAILARIAVPKKGHSTLGKKKKPRPTVLEVDPTPQDWERVLGCPWKDPERAVLVRIRSHAEDPSMPPVLRKETADWLVTAFNSKFTALDLPYRIWVVKKDGVHSSKRFYGLFIIEPGT